MQARAGGIPQRFACGAAIAAEQTAGRTSNISAPLIRYILFTLAECDERSLMSRPKSRVAVTQAKRSSPNR